jgi:anti-sigma B factor antagonist
MGGFQVSVEHHNKVSLHVITLEGELDLYSTPKLRELLTESMSERHASIIIDCSSLIYIDSTGLGALVGGLKEVSNNEGQLSLAGVNNSVQRILQVTGLERLFAIYPTVEEARKAFAAQLAGV